MTAPRPVGKATRATIVVTIVAVIVNLVLTGLGPSGFYATFGVFILLVLSDFGGPLRTRLAAYLVTGLAGLVLIVLGTVAAEGGLAATLVMTALVAFGLAYALVLRGYVAAAYLSLILPYIVAVTTPTTYEDLAIGLGSYAAGAVIAGVTAVVLWPSRPEDGTRRAVGAAVAAAAAVTRGAADPAPGQAGSAADRMRDLDAAYTAMRTSYDGKLERPGDLTTADHALVRLVDDVGRLRYALALPAEEGLATVRPRDRALLDAAAATLEACAQALDSGAAPAAQTIAALHAAQSADVADLPAEADRLLAAGDTATMTRTVDAAFRHRVIAFLTASVARHTLTTLGGGRGASADQAAPIAHEIDRIDHGTRPVDLLRANLNLRSPWLRRALQTSVAVTLAVLAVHELRLEVGFWVVLGIVAALQFTAVHARKSAVEVAGGTIVGFLICAALVKTIGHHTLALVIVLIPVAFLTVWLPHGRWLVPMKQAGFTVWFVMLVSLAHGGMSMHVDEMRVKDVGTGLIIALVTTALLWRGGVAARVTSVLHESARATGDFVTAAYGTLDPTDRSAAQDQADAAARSAVRARDLAAEAADLARTEGGAAEDEARAWTTVANAIDHAMIVGTLVRGLAGYGLAPLPDAGPARALQDSARAGAAELTAATDPHAAADPAAPAPAGPVGADALRADVPGAEIDAAIADWAGRTAPIAVPGGAAVSPGHAAIGVLWARDWAVYFRWMVRHSHPVAAPAATAVDDH